MNLGTFFVALVLVVIVGLVIRSLYKDKKAGKHSCGGNCGACGMCSRTGRSVTDSLSRGETLV